MISRWGMVKSIGMFALGIYLARLDIRSFSNFNFMVAADK